ncbi:MAG: CpaF family protein [Acidimicrobiales bacterium]
MNLLGPLQTHMESPEVKEIMVTSGRRVWVEGRGGIRAAGELTAEQVHTVIERITRFSGRRVDLTSPLVDVRLDDGSRACVVLPPVAVDGAVICIRRFTRSVLPLAAFTDDAGVHELRRLVTSRANVVVSGATSTGKTSLLASLMAVVPQRERIVVVEDTTELDPPNPHLVRLQTRPATADGVGAVSARDLVRASMRLRPDRLVVGEVRGGEVVDMLVALTSGHDGCLSTVHARSAADARERLVTLALRDNPQFDRAALAALVHQAVDAVVHLERLPDGSRRVARIDTTSRG